LANWRIKVSKDKQFIVEYRIPADQVPSGESVWIDILDSTGTPIGAPTEMTRVGSTDVVKATLTAPSTVGKYELEVWIGTWDGTSRTKTETVDYLGLEVVERDIEDRLTDIENKVNSIDTELDDVRAKLDTIMKWLKRHAL